MSSLRDWYLSLITLAVFLFGLQPGFSALPATPSAPPQAAVARPYHVGIQAGHWKNNELPEQLSRLEGSVGTSGGGRTEVDLNLDVAKRVVALLRASGVVVDLLPATVPTGYSADAFVAIHADGNSSPAARGFKISTRWRSVVAVQDARLMETLTSEYRLATDLPEDGSVTRNMRGYYAYSPWRLNYRVSNYTPAAIVEVGFMTNASDRAVMFNRTQQVASSIAAGVTAFLKATYGSPTQARAYGYGIVDGDLVPDAPAPPKAASTPITTLVQGDWQALMMGKPLINVYAGPGGGSLVAQLPRGEFYHATARKGDYYMLDLPGGKSGWVHRNGVIIQTEK